MAKRAAKKKRAALTQNCLQSALSPCSSTTTSFEAGNLYVVAYIHSNLGVLGVASMPSRPRYSDDLRAMVKLFIQAGCPPLDIADDLKVSHQWVYELRRRYEVFGDVKLPSCLASRGRPCKLHQAAIEGVGDFMEEYLQAYMDEVKAFLLEEYEIEVSLSTVTRRVREIGLTNKRTERTYPGRSDELRDAWLVEIAEYEANQLVFVDESAVNERTADRRYGWSPRGFPCRVATPGQRSRRWSLLPAIGINGYLYYEIYHGSFNGERFLTFIHRLLPHMTPYPGPRSVIICDNASIHRSDEVKALCRDHNVRLLFLPPYSPDFNAIEQSFYRIKS